jgi:signal transduction histidine kinase
VQNAAKHSGAATIRVSLTGQDTALGFVVEDDGVGFDPARTPDGTGLANLRDRVESADGTFTMETGLGAGTRIRASLPVRTASPPATMISGD